MVAAMAEARSAADHLQLRSFTLGYNVMHTVSVTTGSGSPPTITYHVRRIDHLALPTRDFPSIAAVEAHLDQLAALPRYRLDLVGDRHIEETSDGQHPFTSITDLTTNEQFHVRVIDLEAFTFLHIHAEEPPSANWHLDP
jgi:hypothetical protein